MRKLIALFCLAAGAVTTPSQAAGFSLDSPTVKSGEALAPAQVLDGFGCSGGNLSPELHWTDAPEAARSFAVTLYDPDAPTGSGWWHWVVFNLPATVASLAAGAGTPASPLLPAGAQAGRNDFGGHGYGGACPPAAAAPHRYVFTVFALDTERIELPADASPALVGYYLHAHRIATATLTAVFGR